MTSTINIEAKKAAEKKAREEREKSEETLARMVERYTNIADPLLQYTRQLDELNILMEKYPEKAEIWMEAARKVREQMNEQAQGAKQVKTAHEQMMEDIKVAAEGYGQSMSNAFVDWIGGAKTSFSDMVRSMIADIAKLIAYQAFFKPLTKGIMGLFGFSNGGVFETAPKAFANGLIDSPTMFPMANGTGIAGESGTEAIMPLRRDANGRLGVSAAGGGGINANININISDVRAQDAPAISRAAQEGVGKAVRGIVQSEIFNGMRTGNALNPLPLRGF